GDLWTYVRALACHGGSPSTSVLALAEGHRLPTATRLGEIGA
ncbi:MAG: hypothetical protein RIR99_314, partial [Actinomycetota bacterium]